MAKRLSAIALVVLLTAGFAYAQEVEISGEMKTGFFWEEIRVDGKKTEEVTKMHNNDDAGNDKGRFRLNMHVHNDYNMGMKVRFEQTQWTSESRPVDWPYVMAYGNFIDKQLRVTVGRLGESPWGAGGPDLWDELDKYVGIRTEIMPNAIPGFGVGFVLGDYNVAPYNKDNVDNLLVDMLMETVLGITYTNDYFHGRFALRLDGEKDSDSFSDTSQSGQREDNMSLIYRFEERIIRQYLPGFSIWSNGYWTGVGEEPEIEKQDSVWNFRNWLYIDYSPEYFSARLAFGLEFKKGMQLFNGRASFYYNIFPFLSAGAAAKYRQEYGEYAKYPDKAFLMWGVEPQLRVTFNPNAYVAFVYNYSQEQYSEGYLEPVIQERQWINLRVVYTF